MTKYLKATMIDGEQFVGEFRRLARAKRFIETVLSGHRPFPLWQVVSETHPHSGEPSVVRRVEYLNPTRIVSIVEVEREDTNSFGYDLSLFQPVVTEAMGGRGAVWRSPDELTPEQAEAGVVAGGIAYPVHREEATLRRYIIAAYNAEAPQESSQFWLDAPAPVQVPETEGEDDGDVDPPADEEDDDDGF